MSSERATSPDIAHACPSTASAGPVVGVGADQIQRLRDVVLVYLGVETAHEVVRDGLVRPLVLVDDAYLPGQKVGCDVELEALPLELPAGVEDALARRKLVPMVQALTPVVEPPDFVQLLTVPNFSLR